MKLRFLLCVSLLVLAFNVTAQLNPSELGDPPVAALITVSPPDDNGIVTISGAAGAVFPAAQLAIRNLYTHETVYVTAGITGSFNAEIYGPGNTPFWISPAQSIPVAQRDNPAALPGGPGTIITGAPPEARTSAAPVTQIIIDGDLGDWQAYRQATLDASVQALVNRDSLYVAVQEVLNADEQARLVVVFTLEDTTYELTLDPFVPQTALVRQIAPVERDPETLAVASAIADGVVEMRIPLLEDAPETVVLEQVFTRAAPDSPPSDIDVVAMAVPFVEEQDGIVYPGGRLSGDVRRFSVGGALAQGAARWNATGRTSALELTPGATLTIEMDVVLQVEDLAESLVGLSLIGEMGLQPVIAETSEGIENIVALHSNNGWSNVLTPSGLAIDNLRADLPLETITIPAPRVVRRGNQLLAGFRFEMTLPDDLPRGLYVPFFEGYAQIGDGEVFAWVDNGVFGVGEGISATPLTRLPLVLNVGGVEDARSLWTLFYDDPADGSRGVMPAEARGEVALSNRVRFNSPTYVLPAGTYPLEPYLLNQLPNSYTDMTAPLLPLLFPAGRMNATVTLPDGTVDDLPDAPFVQNRLSTDAFDERDVFGGQSPQDVYRLTTNDPAYTGYVFDQYGAYTIEANGFVEDIYGNRYDGGGTYEVLIAEPLELLPGVLPGSPFQVGDVFFPGGHVLPQFPAVVDIDVTVYGLDGSVTEHRFEDIQANEYGYYLADGEPFIFETPGEYIIDYEARYTDDQGRLWAASLRSAGVIATPGTPLVAHGTRGIAGYAAAAPEQYRPAWFTTLIYPPVALEEAFLYAPYHGGDVVYTQDDNDQGVRPTLHVQDVMGRYANWLFGSLPDYTNPDGIALEQLIALDELPALPVLGGPRSIYSPPLLPELVVNDAYSYVSATRPGVTVRQFVLGSDAPVLHFHWDNDDPFNAQIGAGQDGNRPDDYAFVFGGTVVRNAEIGLNDAAAYAALAVTTAEDSAARVYPPYRGAAGGPDGGPLLVINETPVTMFFHPTGVRPGDVLAVGDVLAIAGQAAPTLETQVEVTITAPSGATRRFTGLTSPTGYFYDPAQDFAVDEVGVWTVELVVTPAGESSAGRPEAPLPRGAVLGVPDETFRVYVVPEDATPLSWSQEGDVDTDFRPGVPFNFGLNIPPEWTDVQNFYVVRTPSHVYEAGELRRLGNVLNYQYNPRALAGLIGSLEFDGAGEGPASSDVVSLTFVVTGTDATGSFVIRTRTFTIFHDRLVSFED